MTDYLKYKFQDTPEFVNTFDELPLWSESFGLLLLKHVELKPNIKVIDIGSGAGFPLLELASRLGNSCQLYGIDPWHNANNRAKAKIRNYGLTNVEIIESSAEQIPFEDGSVDLIVSNLGINNFSNPQQVFKECQRVLKQDGKLSLTTNLYGHWKEFYNVFYSTLEELKLEKYISILKAEEEHRGTIESVSELFTSNGFKVDRVVKESIEMKFLDGTAFLNHHFIKLGWLSGWMKLFPENLHEIIFAKLEKNLNTQANTENLNLNVSMAFFQSIKI